MTLEPRTIDVSIEDEMRTSYIDYAMSVIIGRALPDVRDGLKPVHRRVLFAMHELRNTWNSAYKKSARVVGDVIGKYHPHGDQAVYDTIVRLAQPFSMRYLLVDGQGNFGSVDGDPAAAMRYTEVRMARLATEILADIDKDTVDFGPNYDDSLQEPLLLPTRVPSLLINGSEGIAVGMATKIPPHNLREIVGATIHLIQNPEASIDDLMAFVQGPDFPTAGFIYGTSGIGSAYRTGRGIVRMRARTETEEISSNREAIIISELPFQVNKARLVEKIASLVREKRLEGISDLRDESDRRGMRVVIELKRDAILEVVLNNLYKMTPMQSSFGIILLAIVRNRPVLLNLKSCLQHFVEHRREVVTRRCRYELRKAEERAHILEGLLTALDNIDAVIELVKGAASPAAAREGLVASFGLSGLQAQAILDMRLQKLTGLEQDKIREEYAELTIEMERLGSILGDDALLLRLIVGELQAIEAQYGDERRTEILQASGDIDYEDLIPEEQVVVTVTHSGYIKRVPLSEYRAQRRGGRGKTGMATKDEDFVKDAFVSSTHTDLIIFTDRGRAFKLKVYQLPAGSRTARGKAVVNLVNLDPGENMASLLPVSEWPEKAFTSRDEEGQAIIPTPEDRFTFFATRKGRVKKTDLHAYKNIRSNGLIAIKLEEGDALVGARIVHGQQDVLMFSAGGMTIRFSSDQARPLGRGTQGVKGMTLHSDDKVVDMFPVVEGASVLTATELGYGKRTPVDAYMRGGKVQNRGGKGLIDIYTGPERNGKVVGARLVFPTDQVIFVTNEGMVVRINAQEVREVQRNSKGVRLLRITGAQRLVALARLDEPEEEEEIEAGEAGIEGTEAGQAEPAVAAPTAEEVEP